MLYLNQIILFDRLIKYIVYIVFICVYVFFWLDHEVSWMGPTHRGEAPLIIHIQPNPHSTRTGPFRAAKVSQTSFKAAAFPGLEPGSLVKLGETLAISPKPLLVVCILFWYWVGPCPLCKWVQSFTQGKIINLGNQVFKFYKNILI